MFEWRMVRIAVAGLVVAGVLETAAAREVEHAMGKTQVPDAPQRVVVLTNEGTEALLALGIKPVGAVKSWTGNPWYPHIADAMQNAVVVGNESAVNLEVIASLRPDLIIGNKFRQEKVYGQLSAIAPTVFSETLKGAWQSNFALYANAVSRNSKGTDVIEAFAARTARIRQQLGDRINEQISLVRFLPGQARIYYNDTFAGTILKQLGFRRPPDQDKPTFVDNVTQERIPEMEGDRLFYFVWDTGKGDALKAEAEWTASSLWKNLKVVRSGNVHRVDDAIWNTAGGVIAANRMLDDIEAIYSLK
jgi:iron complex transport system substrate-binding protein